MAHGLYNGRQVIPLLLGLALALALPHHAMSMGGGGGGGGGGDSGGGGGAGGGMGGGGMGGGGMGGGGMGGGGMGGGGMGSGGGMDGGAGMGDGMGGGSAGMGGGGARDAMQDHDMARAQRMRGGAPALSGMLRQVRQRYPGKVLDVRMERGRNGSAYVFTIMQGNRIVNVRVPLRNAGALRGGRTYNFTNRRQAR